MRLSVFGSRLSALATALLICACHRINTIPADTLVVALSAGPATLDPRYATDAVGMRINSLIFNSLVRLGPDLQPKAEAAERWTLQKNLFTFYLRPDLRFHNGRPVTVEDIEYSFATVLADGSPFANMRDIIRDVKVRQAGPRIEVAIALKNYSDKFLKADLPSVKILPKAECLSAGADFNKVLIGTAPYRFVRQDAAEIELEAVGAAASRHLVFKIIHDDFTRYQKMMKGEVDIAQMEIGQDRIRDFQKRPDAFNVFFYPGLSMSYLLVSFHDPLLRQPEVRRALAQSIARADLIRYKIYGLASPATSLLTPQNPYFNSHLKFPDYDLASATAAIQKLGEVGHELVLKTSTQAVDMAKVLAYQMSQSGLNVQVQSYEWGTFYNDVKHGNFQLATMKWVGTIDPDLYKMAFYSHEHPPGRNRGFYDNPRLDKLLEDGTSEPNFAKRRRIFDEVQNIVATDLAVLPLWYDEQIAVAKKQVLDYQPDQTGNYWPFVEAHKAHD